MWNWFVSIPGQFWGFLGIFITTALTLISQRRNNKNTKNSKELIESFSSDVAEMKAAVKKLDEAHKHEPYFVELQTILEDRLNFKTEGLENEYVSKLLGRALQAVLPYFSLILASDFKIATKERIYKRMTMYVQSIQDGVKREKLGIDLKRESEYVSDVESRLGRCLDTFSIDVDEMRRTKENGVRRDLFSTSCTRLLDEVVEIILSGIDRNKSVNKK